MIYINGRFLKQNITGVQRFAIELLKSFYKIRNDITILVPKIDKIIDKDLLNIFDIKEIQGGDGLLWEQITLPKYLKSLGSPLLINLCNTSPINYKNKISTIHDITFVRYPQSYSWKFRTVYKFLIPLILKTSKKILTVSEFSKQDISKYYHISNDRIQVVYNAVSDSFYKKVDGGIQTEKYALAVSSPNLHKNFGPMIEAFEKANIDLELKIIGSMSGSFKTNNYDIKTDKIKFMGRVNDKELIELYQHAQFFIFPSLYEGFGIPPLEAQACGCPVISSNTASLPEILSNSAYFFDPKNLSDITVSIKKIHKDESLRNDLSEKGSLNIKRFSWDLSADKLNSVVNEVLNT